MAKYNLSAFLAALAFGEKYIANRCLPACSGRATIFAWTTDGIIERGLRIVNSFSFIEILSLNCCLPDRFPDNARQHYWFREKWCIYRIRTIPWKTGQTSGFTSPAARNTRIQTHLDMAKIQSVKAREILDSRGNPTVEVSSWCWNWLTGTHRNNCAWWFLNGTRRYC